MTTSATGEQELDRSIAEVAQGGGLNLAGGIAGTALVYLFSLSAARLAGVEVYGLFTLGLTVTTLVSLVACLGLNTSVVYFASIAIGKQDGARLTGTLLTGLTVSAVAGLAGGSLLWFLATPIAERVFGKPELAAVLRGLSPTVLLFPVSAAALGGTQAFKRMEYSVAVERLLRPGVQLAVSALLLLAGWGVLALEIGNLAAVSGGLLLALAGLNRLHRWRGASPTITWLRWTTLLGFSLPVVVDSVLNYTLGQTEILVVGRFLTAEAVGIYSVSLRTTTVSAVILYSFSLVFAPFIADLFHRHELKQLEALFKMVTKWAFALGLPVCLAFVLFARPLMGLFGPEFSQGADALRILAVGQLANLATGPVGVMIVQSGRPWLNLINSFVFLVVDLALELWLIPPFGLVGAAVAGAVSIVGINLLRLAEVYVVMHMHPYKRSFLWPLAAALLAAGGVLGLSWLGLIALEGIGWVVTAFLALALYAMVVARWGLEAEERAVMELVRQRVTLGQGARGKGSKCWWR